MRNELEPQTTTSLQEHIFKFLNSCLVRALVSILFSLSRFVRFNSPHFSVHLFRRFKMAFSFLRCHCSLVKGLHGPGGIGQSGGWDSRWDLILLLLANEKLLEDRVHLLTHLLQEHIIFTPSLESDNHLLNISKRTDSGRLFLTLSTITTSSLPLSAVVLLIWNLVKGQSIVSQMFWQCDRGLKK